MKSEHYNNSAKYLMQQNDRNYIRKGTYSIDMIRSLVVPNFSESMTDRIMIDIDGDKVNANSQRYKVFFTKSTKCCRCGISGSFFRKEKTRNCEGYHLNLYAVTDDGVEVLMTKDHIIQKSKGGKNTMDNYQTMCQICNKAKGNSMEG